MILINVFPMFTIHLTTLVEEVVGILILSTKGVGILYISVNNFPNMMRNSLVRVER